MISRSYPRPGPDAATVVALALLVLTLALAAMVAGCRPATGGTAEPDGGLEPDPIAPGLGAFADGQVLKYEAAVTVDGRSGTGERVFKVSRDTSGAVVLSWSGNGPGLPGAPIYDAAPFEGSAALPSNAPLPLYAKVIGEDGTIVEYTVREVAGF